MSNRKLKNFSHKYTQQRAKSGKVIVIEGMSMKKRSNILRAIYKFKENFPEN